MRLASFGILWFFLSISVESSLISLTDLMFEHRVYLPSAGFFVAVSACSGVVCFRRSDARIPKAAISVVMLMTLVFSAAAYARNGVWSDGVTLWTDAVKKSPGNSRARYNLGLELHRKGLYEEAMRQYEAALLIDPIIFGAHLNLAQIYSLKGEREKSIGHLGEALRLRPDSGEALDLLSSWGVERNDEGTGDISGPAVPP